MAFSLKKTIISNILILIFHKKLKIYPRFNLYYQKNINLAIFYNLLSFLKFIKIYLFYISKNTNIN